MPWFSTIAVGAAWRMPETTTVSTSVASASRDVHVRRLGRQIDALDGLGRKAGGVDFDSVGAAGRQKVCDLEGAAIGRRRRQHRAPVPVFVDGDVAALLTGAPSVPVTVPLIAPDIFCAIAKSVWARKAALAAAPQSRRLRSEPPKMTDAIRAFILVEDDMSTPLRTRRTHTPAVSTRKNAAQNLRTWQNPGYARHDKAAFPPHSANHHACWTLR